MGDPDPEPHKVKISEPNMESGDQEPDNPKPLKGILKTSRSINPGDTFDEDDEVVGTRLGLVRIIKCIHLMKTDMTFFLHPIPVLEKLKEHTEHVQYR